MTETRLEAVSPGHFRLSGELTFASVPGLLGRARELFAEAGDVSVSLDGVSRADSAGLALLVDWRREAGRLARRICFDQVPAKMLALAQVCGVDELLALDAR